MFDCVIAAAGASSRMGAPDGRAALKPLLPFAGSTLVETAVAAALGAGCRVILVVGNRGAEVASLFEAEAHRAAREGGRILVVDNPRWEDGLLGSIQAAIRAMAPAGGVTPRVAVRRSFFLAHADMPFVGSAAYRALAAASAAMAPAEGCAEPGPTAFIASHGGVRGHPVLLPSAWMTEILALDPRGRMRDFLADRPAALVETGSGALRDIDTPGDYHSAMEGP
jgi:molybdenum cofactor cytidylyltransferase